MGLGILLKKKTKAIEDNPNNLLKKDKPLSILKKKKTNFKEISTYKPSGIIYNNELIKKIEFNVNGNSDHN